VLGRIGIFGFWEAAALVRANYRHGFSMPTGGNLVVSSLIKKLLPSHLPQYFSARFQPILLLAAFPEYQGGLYLF